jgi:hypothetical protein
MVIKPDKSPNENGKADANTAGKGREINDRMLEMMTLGIRLRK